MMSSDEDFITFVNEDCNSNFELHTHRGIPNDSPCRDCKSPQSRNSNTISNTSTSFSRCGNFQLNCYSDVKGDVSRRARSSSSSCSEQNLCETSQNYYYEDFETDSSEMSLSSSSCSADEQLETKEKELPKRKKENELQHQGRKQLPKKKKKQRTLFSRDRIINSQKNTKVNHRLLSARLLKIKELQNEMSVVKNRLEESTAESQILRQHHDRLLQAIRKYEKAETSLPDLMAKHYTEVKTLRALLRNSQEQERQTARKLRHVETNLLEEKDTLQALQRLSQDKNLAERGELTHKLTLHTERMEANYKKIQGLENQLRLNNTSFSRLLAAEKKKGFQAQLITMNLEMEFKLLNQKIKEKERELSIRNIYSNRMLKDQQKRCDSESTPKVTNVSTSVQVDMILEEMPLQKDLTEKSSVLKEDSNETMSLGSLEESGRGQSTQWARWISSGVTDTSGMASTHHEWTNEDISAEDKPPYDVQKEKELRTEYHQTEKLPMKNYSNEIDTELLEEKTRPRTERLEELRADELIQLIYDEQQKANLEETATEEQENSKDEEIVIQGCETSLQLKKHYVFTNAIENLHQGYPSTGPLSSTTSTKSCRQISRQPSKTFKARKSISAYEPSFGNINKIRQNDITPTCGEDKIPVVPTNKKIALLEELFGSNCILKDINSDFNLKEVDKEK